jgi:hypothetical protein
MVDPEHHAAAEIGAVPFPPHVERAAVLKATMTSGLAKVPVRAIVLRQLVGPHFGWPDHGRMSSPSRG